MSNSFVQKSLELVWNDELFRTQKNARNNDNAPRGESVIDHNKAEQKKKKKKKKGINIKYKGVLDLIPAKHRIVSTYDNTDICTILNRSRTTVYETRKRIATQQDPTNDNVEKLLSLSHNTLKTETANNLLQRAVKKRSCRKEKKPKKSEETVFTEEDFKKFEQEYVE